MQNKFAWISTPDELWDDKKEMITTALESGIDHVLDFDDIDPTSIGLSDTTEEYSFTDDGYLKVFFFTDSMAKQTIDFIEKNKDKDFYIHCSAGLSRSQAFVKYIKNVYFDNDWETNPGNPCRYANGFVYQKLMHAYRCREENFNLFDRFS